MNHLTCMHCRPYSYCNKCHVWLIHVDFLRNRQKDTSADEERLREAASINKSLSTLGWAFPQFHNAIRLCFFTTTAWSPERCYIILQLISVSRRLVIRVLVDIANGKQRHVPYRNSKLTFLLQVNIALVNFDLNLHSELQLSVLLHLLTLCKSDNVLVVV